jgi:hypothetical protein
LGVCEQDPAVHASSVHATPSSHSEALQQVPQLAEPWPLAQHLSLPVQSGTTWHCPLTHLPSLQASGDGHCESLQHWAQPTPSQHTVPFAQ